MTPLQEIQIDTFHQADYFRMEQIGWGVMAAVLAYLLWRGWYWRPPPPGGTPC